VDWFGLKKTKNLRFEKTKGGNDDNAAMQIFFGIQK